MLRLLFGVITLVITIDTASIADKPVNRPGRIVNGQEVREGKCTTNITLLRKSNFYFYKDPRNGKSHCSSDFFAHLSAEVL